MTPALKQRKINEHLCTIARYKDMLNASLKDPDELPERLAIQELLRTERAALTKFCAQSENPQGDAA